MDSHCSDQNSNTDNESVQSSPIPRELLKGDLPNTLPGMLINLKIDFADLHLINDGESHIVYGFLDRADDSQWVIRVAIHKAFADTEDDFPSELTMYDHAAVLGHIEPLASKFGSIPRVSHVDSTNNNEFGHAFMIGTLIPGKPVYETFDNLPLEDKTYVVQIVIHIWKDLSPCHSPLRAPFRRIQTTR